MFLCYNKLIALKYVNHKKHGFTVVELLIVIVVIVILATIITFSYKGISENAKSAALISSLRNVATAIETQLEIDRADTSNLNVTGIPESFSPEKDIVLQIAGSADGARGYCINAYRISSYEIGSYDSKHGTYKNHLCPGVLIGSPVGGSVPLPPKDKNLVADFSEWTLTGGATYDSETGVVNFSDQTAKALSPLVGIDGSSSITIEHQAFSALPSTYYSPKSGTLMGTSYFAADGVTLVASTAGYTSNGNAGSFPLSQWSPRDWTITTGPSIKYVRVNIQSSTSSYTSDSFQVKSPVIKIRS